MTPVINPNADIQERLFKGEAPPHFGLFTLTLEARGVYLIMLKTQIKSSKLPPATLVLYIPLPHMF